MVSDCAVLPRDLIILRCLDQLGTELEEHAISLLCWWEEVHPVIDERAYRAERGIRRIVGRQFDQKGRIEKEFEVHYAGDGSYLNDVVRESRTWPPHNPEPKSPPARFVGGAPGARNNGARSATR